MTLRRAGGLVAAIGLAFAISTEATALEPTRGILDEIAGYDAKLAELDEADKAMAAREATLLTAVEAHNADEATASAEVERRREDVDRGMRAAYRLQRRGFARLLFDAQSPDELRRRVHYLLASVTTQRASIATFRDLVDKRTQAAAAAEAEMKELNTLRAARDAQRATWQEERTRRVELLRMVRESLPMTGKYRDESTEARSDFNTSVALHEGTMPESTPGTEGFREARGQIPWPIRGRLFLGWGPYADSVTGDTLQNLGYDIAAPPGTPFRAVYAGTVTRSGYVRGYGQVVMLQHGSYATLYAHANGLRVAQGQDVAAGDVLGLVGTTGLLDESAARLHFEVRYNGTPQDPGEWLVSQ